MSEEERRRRNRERARQKARRKKKKKRAVLLALFLLLIIAVVGVFAYLTSYIGAVNKGNRALGRNDYTTAEDSFRNALAKDDTRPEAYTGLSKVYQAQDNADKAERLFTSALKKQGENIELSNSIFVLIRKRRFRNFWMKLILRYQMHFRNI